MENWKNKTQDISNKFDNQSPNRDEIRKEIVDKFNFDTEKQHDKNSTLEDSNPIKKDLYLKINQSQFKKYYTRNYHRNGAELKVNKEIGEILRPFELNGKSSVIQNYNGRKFVLANVDGKTMPFYSSSQGTDGKNKDEWYPFYGFSPNWVIKDSFDQNNEWNYNRQADTEMQEKIKEVSQLLSENISLPLNPSNWVDNIEDYFSYQEIDDKHPLIEINNALGLPKDIDLSDVSRSSGYDVADRIKKHFLDKQL